MADYLLARPGTAQFLPDGSLRLWLFLTTLYTGVGGLMGFLVGALFLLLARCSDLGSLAKQAQNRPAGRWIAYGLAGTSGAIGFGWGVHQIALISLLRFHGHFLIAALVGTTAAMLMIPISLAVFLLARLLSPLLPCGPRPTLRLSSPIAWLSGWWLIGLFIAAAGTFELVERIQGAKRMTAPIRALNIGLWAPPICIAGFALAHVVGRIVWRRWAEGRMAIPLLNRPLSAVITAAALLLLAAGVGVAATWPLMKLLPWPAFVVSGIALATGMLAGAAGLGSSLDRRPPWLRGGLPLTAALVLIAAGLYQQRVERVRKAAVVHAALAGPLLETARLVSDFDRDGYSGLLGADCDDFDADIHPGAIDLPDDGIDQNCNGHQATAHPAPHPPFVPLPATVPKQPHVILITIDAVRADHVGAYGYPRATTPQIDTLARDAVLFKNGWAHSPSTRYSVPAILTGRYESTIAWGSPAQHWPPPVLPKNRLLAEMLHERGYRTAALLPYHYFERAWGVDQGFDDYDYSLSRLHSNPFNGDPARAAGSSSKEMADLAISYLQEHRRQPLFLWMHFYDPHYLYERHVEVPAFGESEADLYDGELRFTDLHVGRVLDTLKQTGLWDQSIIVLTSDHGEGLGEHNIRQHGYHIYVQQNKVPFIVRVPGISPRVVDEPVGHVDLFPSLLNLLGAPDEPQLLGRSFVDLMTGSAPFAPRQVFGEVEYEGPVVRKSVATSVWHLIANVVPDHTFELYHLASDPEEAHDLAGYGHPEEAQLTQELAAWMDQTALPGDGVPSLPANLAPHPFPYKEAIGSNLGQLLEIDGATVPTSVRAGETLTFELIMHARRPIPTGWRLFTHVVAEDGRFLNADHQPVAGQLTLQKMRPGQYVRDPIETAVPRNWPPGSLTIRVGLFRGPERAVATGPRAADDHIAVATLRVVP